MTPDAFGFETKTRALLQAIEGTGSISAAARHLGLDPGNATRHLRTAERRLGHPLVEARRGGRGGPHARLLPAARTLLDAAQETLAGVAAAYDGAAGLTPVHVGRRVVHVAGPAPAGPVRLRIPAEAVGIERPSADGTTTRSSLRNRWPARVVAVDGDREGVLRVRLASGALTLDALVTRSALAELRLRPGSRVRATVKAAAVRWHVPQAD